MTIPDLLCERGYWPTPNGPMRSGEWQSVGIMKADKRLKGQWQNCTASMWIYIPDTKEYAKSYVTLQGVT